MSVDQSPSSRKSCSLNGVREGISLVLGIVARDGDDGVGELCAGLGLSEVFEVRDEESGEFFWTVEVAECGYVCWDLDHGEA